MKKFIKFILLVLMVWSCYTPKKAFEKGYYKTSLQLAASQIHKGKDQETNTVILKNSVEKLISECVEKNKFKIESGNVKEWKIVQNEYYTILEAIGKANIKSGYMISDIYNEFCDTKLDLDFMIVDHYYQKGINLLDKSILTGDKKSARRAYYEFAEADKNGGTIFYSDINDLMVESHMRGIVYYFSSDYDLGSSFFEKPLPFDADFEPDCIITIDEGSIFFTESKKTTKEEFSKEIQSGFKIEKDTSGNETEIPIYETIFATLITTEYTITATQTVWINAFDNTGQCSMSFDVLNFETHEIYEDIKVEGDRNALEEYTDDQSGEPSFLKSDMERNLRDIRIDRLENYL